MASVGAKGRRERHTSEMRQDILQAAQEIIAEEGANALSIRGIARKIGYSAPALYEYFDGKEAIARALFTDGFTQLADAMEAAEREYPEPRPRLRQLGAVYRIFALAHPQEYSIMFSRPIPEFAPTEEELSTIAARAFAPLWRGYDDLIRASGVRGIDARTAATVAWGTVHGLVSLELAGMGGPPPQVELPPGLAIPADLALAYDAALDGLGMLL